MNQNCSYNCTSVTCSNTKIEDILIKIVIAIAIESLIRFKVNCNEFYVQNQN